MKITPPSSPLLCYAIDAAGLALGETIYCNFLQVIYKFVGKCDIILLWKEASYSFLLRGLKKV